MKKSIYLLGLVSVVLFSSLVFLLQVRPAKASDPSYPDQGCVNGVQNSGLYTWADHSPTVVFTPRFNWLNAVSVRIKGTNPTGTPRVQAQIWDWHSSPHRMMASHTVELTNRTSEYWEYITESSQDMDPGLPYALVLVPKDGTQVYWSATSNTSCYTRGYAMHDGAQDLSLMYGFSTYGWYDPNNPNSDGTMPGSGTPSGGSTSGTTSSTGSTGAPVSDPSGDNPSGVGTNSGSSGSNSSGSSGVSSNNGSTESPENMSDLINSLRNDSSGTTFLDKLGWIFASPILFLLWPVLSFLFWVGVIILIIVLIRRHNKKKNLPADASRPAMQAGEAKAAASAPAPAPTQAKSEEKKK